MPNFGTDTAALVTAANASGDPTFLEAIIGSTSSRSSLWFAINGTVTTTPLPAALPLFATGLGALGLLGWRRKRQACA